LRLREPSVVERPDRLHVPHRKRLTHAYATTESGTRELCLYHGTQEVVFDEERFFAFGEQLLRQTSFLRPAALRPRAGEQAVAVSGTRPRQPSPEELDHDDRGRGLVAASRSTRAKAASGAGLIGIRCVRWQFGWRAIGV
jgi:hypothetical protein